MQRRYEVELIQNIKADDFDSLVNLRTRVELNSTKCKVFHFGSDKNMLWYFSLAKPRLVRNLLTSDVAMRKINII